MDKRGNKVKIIYLMLASLVDILLIALIILNTTSSTTFNLLPDLQFNLTIWGIMVISAILGSMSTSLLFMYIQCNQKENAYKHLRLAEKASIQAEEGSDRIKSLEAKIVTLEQALQKALKK